MRKMLKYGGAVLSGIIMLSCDSVYQTPPLLIKPRISILTQNSETADITVELEGPDGNSINGAAVLLSNSSNGVRKCSYDPSKGLYVANTGLPSDGIFNFSIRTNLADRGKSPLFAGGGATAR